MLHPKRWSDSARTKKAEIGRHDNDYVAKLLLTSGGLNGQPGRTMLHQLRYADASITVLFMNLFGVSGKVAPPKNAPILNKVKDRSHLDSEKKPRGLASIQQTIDVAAILRPALLLCDIGELVLRPCTPLLLRAVQAVPVVHPPAFVVQGVVLLIF